MADPSPPVKRTIGALKNVASFYELVLRVRDRSPSLPNIGVMYGPSGFGKTYATLYSLNRTRGVYVEVGDTWTRKTLLTAILQECGVYRPTGSIAEMAQQAKETLAEDPTRPLFIDEADKVCDKNYIETVRELAMGSNVPVLLIGEEALPTKLARVERVHSRVLDWCGAMPCDLDDAQKLADILLGQITIEPELLEQMRIEGDGRARRIATSLDGAAHWARNTGVTALSRANYKGAIYTGEPPKNRAASLRVRGGASAQTSARRA